MSRFWSKNIESLKPYTPGEQPKQSKLIKLNTNENPYGPSPMVKTAIAEANNDDLRKYPDPSANELKREIANYYSLAADQVFVGNSSDEVLAHTFRALLDQDLPLLFPDITYSFYPVYCQLFGINFQQVPLADNFTINIEDYRMDNGGIIFANPNAPTGLALSADQIAELLHHNTNSVVVVDEAYADFSECSAVSMIEQFPNLLVAQTLSKSRCLAGLRVGFALGDKELIEALERVKNSFHPYTLDTLALAGARAAFADKEYFDQTINNVIATREWCSKELNELGFEVVPSSANFVFVTHPLVPAATLFNKLREHNIVIRYFDLPRINNHIRITIGTDQEMTSLLNALKEILSA